MNNDTIQTNPLLCDIETECAKQHLKIQKTPQKLM